MRKVLTTVAITAVLCVAAGLGAARVIRTDPASGAGGTSQVVQQLKKVNSQLGKVNSQLRKLHQDLNFGSIGKKNAAAILHAICLQGPPGDAIACGF